MKKNIFMKSLLLVIISINLFSLDVFGYDQTFPTVQLRYGHTYKFSDEFSNHGNTKLAMTGYSTDFIEQGNINAGPNPSFPWTSEFTAQKFIVNPFQSIDVVESSSNYEIAAHPIKRQSGNLAIIYTATFYEYKNNKWRGPFTHSEYQPYEVTWCGDGIVDSGYETCDPNDPNKVGWGVGGGCNNSCQPTQAPEPTTCDDLDVKPTMGTAPFIANIQCSATNSQNLYTIFLDGPDGRITNFDSADGTASYNFTTPGTYTATCYVNRGHTSSACEKTITVKPPTTNPNTPSCDSLSVTPTSGVAPLATSLSCNGTKADNYKIEILNGSTVIETINNRSGAYQFTNVGNYSARCSINGNITSNACTKSINVTPVTSGPSCGNAVIETGETCDNGAANGTPGNSCSATCGPVTSGPVCGNAVIETGETCDNGAANGTPGNACSATCGPVTTSTNSCNTLGMSVVSGRDTLTSVATCNGTNVSSYEIDCGNGQKFTGSGSNSGVENFTETCNYSGNRTYTPTCRINGEAQVPTCSSTVTLNGGGSGGGSPGCNSIVASITSAPAAPLNSVVTCGGNSRVNTFKLDCGNGQVFVGAANNVSGGTSYSNTCKYIANGDFRPQCFVSKSTTTNANSVTRTHASCSRNIVIGKNDGGGGGSGQRCGDGVIQTSRGESCDLGARNGQAGELCSSSCTLVGNFLTKPSSKGNITLPYGGQILIGYADSTIIGHGDNVFSNLTSDHVSLKNESQFDISLGDLCVVKSGTGLNGVSQCRNSGVLQPGQRFTFSPSGFTGNKNAIPAGASYGKAQLEVTLKEDGAAIKDAWFGKKISVKVSKPSIVTSGGGVNYIKDTSKIADINEVKKNDNNKNFIGVGASDTDISSYSKTADDEAKQQIKDAGEKLADTSNTLLESEGERTSSVVINKVSQSYRGMANTYHLENKSMRLTNDTGLVSGSTYVIENGDLFIDADIDTVENVLFVVKGGNIKIDSGVQKINATLITIPKDGNYGKISSGATKNILQVRGALYGDINGLVDNRTYIKETGDGLQVGTIVSFGSQMFKKPAPLLNSFVDEYINATKVVQ